MIPQLNRSSIIPQWFSKGPKPFSSIALWVDCGFLFRRFPILFSQGPYSLRKWSWSLPCVMMKNLSASPSFIRTKAIIKFRSIASFFPMTNCKFFSPFSSFLSLSSLNSISRNFFISKLTAPRRQDLTCKGQDFPFGEYARISISGKLPANVVATIPRFPNSDTTRFSPIWPESQLLKFLAIIHCPEFLGSGPGGCRAVAKSQGKVKSRLFAGRRELPCAGSKGLFYSAGDPTERVLMTLRDGDSAIWRNQSRGKSYASLHEAGL